MSELSEDKKLDIVHDPDIAALLDGSVTPASIMEQVNNFYSNEKIEEGILLHKKVGEFYRINKEHEKAIEIYTKITDYNQDVQALFAIAGIYKDLNDKENAIEFYRKVLRVEDSHKEALREFAELNFEIKKYDTAIMALRQLIKIEPDNINVIEKIAFISEMMGSTRGALANYIKAAECAREKKFYNKAEELLNKVLAIKPTHKEAQNELKIIQELIIEEKNRPQYSEEVTEEITEPEETTETEEITEPEKTTETEEITEPEKTAETEEITETEETAVEETTEITEEITEPEETTETTEEITEPEETTEITEKITEPEETTETTEEITEPEETTETTEEITEPEETAETTEETAEITEEITEPEETTEITEEITEPEETTEKTEEITEPEETTETTEKITEPEETTEITEKITEPEETTETTEEITEADFEYQNDLIYLNLIENLTNKDVSSLTSVILFNRAKMDKRFFELFDYEIEYAIKKDDKKLIEDLSYLDSIMNNLQIRKNMSPPYTPVPGELEELEKQHSKLSQEKKIEEKDPGKQEEELQKKLEEEEFKKLEEEELQKKLEEEEFKKLEEEELQKKLE
ncbi:MAG: tetratricopeptide repeat protein, partial [Candidatus Eremiobacterota bacterium]